MSRMQEQFNYWKKQNYWFWLTVCQEATGNLSARAAIIWRFNGGQRIHSQNDSLRWLSAEGLGSLTHGTLLGSCPHGMAAGFPQKEWHTREERGSCNAFYGLTLEVTHAQHPIGLQASSVQCKRGQPEGMNTKRHHLGGWRPHNGQKYSQRRLWAWPKFSY